MKKFVFSLLLPLALFAETPAQPSKTPHAAATAPAQTGADPVVLTIGDQKITKSQFETIVATLPENQRSRFSEPAERRKLAGEIAGMEALAIEARARKVDQAPDVRQMVRMQADSVLANALVRKEMAADHANTTVLHDYYDKHKADFQEVKVSHILIRFKGSPVPLRKDQKDLTDAEALARAQSIREKLVQGADFAQLAKNESDDTGSGAQGGALPPFGRESQIAPEFKQASFQLKDGELSQPVKTQFGYHLIKVSEHTTKTFEQAQPQVEQQVARAFVDNVKKQFPLTLDPSYFGKE